MEASLEAQYSSRFATSCLFLVTKAFKKISQLGDQWFWEEENLVFAGVGSPMQHLENLKNGFFRPTVTHAAKVRRANKINTWIQYRHEVEQASDEEDEPDFVTAADIIVEELPVENYEPYKEIRATTRLQSLCEDICTAYKERVVRQDVVSKAVPVFHEDDLSWFKSDCTDLADSENEENEEETNFNQGRIIMKDLLDSWDQPVAASYDLDKVTEGFLTFVQFRKSCSSDKTLEDVYAKFLDRLGELNIIQEFTDMFETIQIKSFSEAVCESIGSVMKIAKGKGRNCDPVNFSKEMILSYNLPPLHILSQGFIPKIVKELSTQKEYFRRGDSKYPSVRNQFKSSMLSASLHNFQKEEEMKSKLPIDIIL